MLEFKLLFEYVILAITANCGDFSELLSLSAVKVLDVVGVSLMLLFVSVLLSKVLTRVAENSTSVFDAEIFENKCYRKWYYV